MLRLNLTSCTKVSQLTYNIWSQSYVLHKCYSIAYWVLSKLSIVNRNRVSPCATITDSSGLHSCRSTWSPSEDVSERPVYADAHAGRRRGAGRAPRGARPGPRDPASGAQDQAHPALQAARHRPDTAPKHTHWRTRRTFLIYFCYLILQRLSEFIIYDNVHFLQSQCCLLNKYEVSWSHRFETNMYWKELDKFHCYSKLFLVAHLGVQERIDEE